jgi:hypothetical protein
MFRGVRQHLSYANVVSTLCLFLVVGGGSAVALSGSNTVLSDDIKNGEVKARDLAPQPHWHAIKPGATGSDKCAVTAGAFCSYFDGTAYHPWFNFGAPFQPAGYFKDAFGFVHLRGVVDNPTLGTGPDSSSSTHEIFVLPAAMRPPEDVILASVGDSPVGDTDDPDFTVARIDVQRDGSVVLSFRCVQADAEIDCSAFGRDYLSLDGLEFRAG